MIIFSAMDDPDDEAYMEQLYRQYHVLLFYIAKKYLHEDGAAEDVVQDAFLKLIPKVSLLRCFDGGRLRAYLAATVRNTAYTKSAKLKEERIWLVGRALDETIDQLPDVVLSMEDDVLRQERREAFSKVLNALEDHDRFLLEAKYYLQQSDAEIAEALQVKPSSVRMMLTRARRKVLQQLQEGMGDHG
jgi:RNA polymerase sigma-70 factor (ECF subfamily)